MDNLGILNRAIKVILGQGYVLMLVYKLSVLQKQTFQWDLIPRPSTMQPLSKASIYMKQNILDNHHTTTLEINIRDGHEPKKLWIVLVCSS